MRNSLGLAYLKEAGLVSPGLSQPLGLNKMKKGNEQKRSGVYCRKPGFQNGNSGSRM